MHTTYLTISLVLFLFTWLFTTVINAAVIVPIDGTVLLPSKHTVNNINGARYHGLAKREIETRNHFSNSVDEIITANSDGDDAVSNGWWAVQQAAIVNVS